MANYVLTGMAERDVENIAQYTLEEFGLAQAEKYLSGLHQALCTLAEYPTIGSNQNHIKVNSRRYVYRSHSIYYLQQDHTVVIFRILGPGEDPLTQITSGYESH